MSPVKRGRRVRNKIRKGHPDKVHRPRRRIRALDLTMHQWIRFFSLAAVILMAAVTVAGIMIHDHYVSYPGRVERDSIRAVERGSDHVTLAWDETRNTKDYKVYCKEHTAATDNIDEIDDTSVENTKAELDDTWIELRTVAPMATVGGLKEDTSYSFIVRADNDEHQGLATKIRNFRTKKPQTLSVPKMITKFTCSKPFRINAVAETGLVYESSDPSVAEVTETGEIRINSAGTADITVRAQETQSYEGAEDTVEVKAIETKPVDAGGASAHIIYHLDSDNCEVVKRVTGAGGAVVPQGLGYSGDKYIISYGMGSPNRIVSFDVDGDGKDVSVPKIALGHPNGFTYADENGRCYCVKGWSSKAVTYEPTSGSYSSVTLPYGCSGIGYDRKEKLLYTCSRTVMAAYDISDGSSVKYKTGVVKHSGHVYTQDCGGHAGLMLRCLSGSNKHGTNYIDIYDMKHGKYLGTFSCDLSEVESCIVDNEGFLEILANNTSGTDYIWKTDINIETLGEGLE